MFNPSSDRLPHICIANPTLRVGGKVWSHQEINSDRECAQRASVNAVHDDGFSGTRRTKEEEERQENIGLTKKKDGKQFRQKPGAEGRRAGLRPSLPVVVKRSRQRTSNARDNDHSATEKKSVGVWRV